MAVPHLDLTDEPTAEDLAVVVNGLADFNAADVGPSGRKSLVIIIRDDSGKALGGLSGYTGWGWLFTQWLFVPESLRGHGMAGRLLEKAEAEAIDRECHGAWIDTFSPHALKAYQRQGYEIFGELPEFIPGRNRTFLKKSLVRSSA